ncbi:MAG: hypothetical protein OFPII_27330 [Osedax symbiont Rs1]|nr:MAG: hypothetical protein OFPII_27330 [Osedax symbiont Rs1]
MAFSYVQQLNIDVLSLEKKVYRCHQCSVSQHYKRPKNLISPVFSSRLAKAKSAFTNN